MGAVSNLFNVNIYTPKGLYFSGNCECVNFCINASKDDGDFGSYGIKKGHADAVFSVGEGTVSLKKDGKVLFDAKCSEGFAVVNKGVLTITLENIVEKWLEILYWITIEINGCEK